MCTQDILAYTEHQDKLLAVIGDEKFEAMMKESWKDDGQSSQERWDELVTELDKENKKQKVWLSTQSDIVVVSS